MITLRGVSKWYYEGEKVLTTVNLALKQGDFLYVLGGSGVGKSTLLRLVASEEHASVGSVELFGYDLARVSPLTLKAIRRSIGYVPQDIRLIPDLTVFDNVVLSLSLSGRPIVSKQVRTAVNELLERMGLIGKRGVLASRISGGEAQRVAVARALVRTPELIVADEPTGAQDREHTWSMMDLFVTANKAGCSILLATHDREIVRRVQKRCAVLDHGQVRVEDSVCFF